MTKIINGEVIATLRFKIDISLDVPESEITNLGQELFGDSQIHSLQEVADELKRQIEDVVPADAVALGAKAVCNSCSIIREA